MRYSTMVLTVAMAAACAGPNDATKAPVPAEALAAIDTATLMQHIRVLADDSLQGRGPGTLGEERTAAYIESQFKAAGLKPGKTPATAKVQRMIGPAMLLGTKRGSGGGPGHGSGGCCGEAGCHG